jgi:hypothetical protein
MSAVSVTFVELRDLDLLALLLRTASEVRFVG